MPIFRRYDPERILSKGDAMKCREPDCGAEVDLSGLVGETVALPRGPGSNGIATVCSRCGRLYWPDGSPATHQSEGHKKAFFKEGNVVYVGN
jgi:hypothetical protein